MSHRQLYAAPISHLALDASEVSRLRDELAAAEAEARRATSWTWRTRFEQEANSLRRRLAGAEVQARVEAQQARINAPRQDVHAAALRRAVSEGRCLAPVAYFAEPARHAAEDSLTALKQEQHTLQAVIDNPATAAADRLHAQARLDQVKELIKALESAQHPTGSVGMSRNASGDAPITFAQMTRMVELGRVNGVFKT